MLLNTQNINEIIDFLNTLSFNNFKNIVEQYSNKNNVNFDSQMETITVLEKLGGRIYGLKCWRGLLIIFYKENG